MASSIEIKNFIELYLLEFGALKIQER